MNIRVNVDNDTKSVTRLTLEPVGPDDEAFLARLYKALRFGWEIEILAAEGRNRIYRNGFPDEEPE